MNRRNFLILLWLLLITAFPQWIHSVHRELAAGSRPRAEHGCTRAILTPHRHLGAGRKTLQKHLFPGKPTDEDVLGDTYTTGEAGAALDAWPILVCLDEFSISLAKFLTSWCLLGSHWGHPLCTMGWWFLMRSPYKKIPLPWSAEEGVASDSSFCYSSALWKCREVSRVQLAKV